MLNEEKMTEYQKFFMGALKKFGVNSPAEFKSEDEKKKFFNYVDKNWTGEKSEELEAHEDIVSEANAFLKARAAAIWEGNDEFEFNGKIYPVVKVVEELIEEEDAPFTSKELSEIENATKTMADYLTDPDHPTMMPYTHFTFRDLKKDINKKAPEVEYIMRNRNGMAQFLWVKSEGEVSCEFSVQTGRGSSTGGFPSFVGRNVKGVVNKFMRFMKKNFG